VADLSIGHSWTPPTIQIKKNVEKECEAKLLQSIRSIPSSCWQRIAEFNQPLWTQLKNNERLCVAIQVETLTVLCLVEEQIDITVTSQHLDGTCASV
jgi:hypothetical protein